MKKFMMFLGIGILLPWVACAQYEDLTPLQIQHIIDSDIMTDQVKEISAPLKNHIDYVVSNYPEGKLRKIIVNMEETEQKIAKQQGRQYIPYDRRINVKNPNQVQRFLRKRVNAVY